jgi:hypothetical protein
MGYAIVDNGKIVKTGVVTAKGAISHRLRKMSDEIDQLGPFEGVAIEKLRSQRGHIFLVWSAACAVAGANCLATVEVPTKMWSQAKDSAYYKDDEQDARYIAKFILGFLRGDIG